MWYYLTTADMQFFKGKVDKETYWKLSHQCRKRVPMLKSVYITIKKQHEKF